MPITIHNLSITLRRTTTRIVVGYDRDDLSSPAYITYESLDDDHAPL